MDIIENLFKEVQGGANICTLISNLLGKVFTSATAKTMQETAKQTAKIVAQNVGKATIMQTGEKAVKIVRDKLTKLLASKPAKKAKSSPNEMVIQENPSMGLGPNLGNTFTNGLVVKII